MTSTNPTDRAELILRASRRALFILLAMVVLIAATLVAHVLRPGSLMADWASRMPWLLFVGIVALFGVMNASLRFRPDDPEVKTMLNDEFRQKNLARAQRVALVVTLVVQLPLAIVASTVSVAAAVTLMGVGTVTATMATLIISFLYFDRD